MGRSNELNCRVDLVDIVRFVMEQGRQLHGDAWIIEIVNGRGCKRRNALHVLCNVYNENFIALARLLVHGGIKVNSVDDEGQNEDALDLLFRYCSHREDLIQLFRLLVGPCERARNEQGKTALDLLFQHHNNSRVTPDGHQLLLLPFVKLLIEQSDGALSHQTGSPLYRFIQHYKGDDLVDIVKYFVIEKKIPFKPAKAMKLLLQRQDYNLLPNQKVIARILLYRSTQ